MRQQIITENRADRFEDKVNQLMNDGWMAVPATHVVAKDNDSIFGYFAIVLEKKKMGNTGKLRTPPIYNWLSP